MNTRLIPVLLLMLTISLQSCGLNEREKKLKKRLKETTRKEQQLLAWEQRLKMKEDSLEFAKQSLDSTNKGTDTVSTYDPAIVGKWNVKMSCIETSCSGSAIGDTKTETWAISYMQNTVVVNAYSGTVLTRVYIGTYKNKVLQILDEKPNAGALIIANLNFTSEDRMDGNREVVQNDDCKIVYALNARKVK
ncbi:hypothetical protein [Pedobacter immunditicola]|uniref:hypothetical protein n=1 Tax=Pedobacter immunditicola TaxID=3133440 RepID=UPI0030B49581